MVNYVPSTLTLCFDGGIDLRVQVAKHIYQIIKQDRYEMLRDTGILNLIKLSADQDRVESG